MSQAAQLKTCGRVPPKQKLAGGFPPQLVGLSLVLVNGGLFPGACRLDNGTGAIAQINLGNVLEGMTTLELY
jgi:hypothetical protein